MTASAPGLVYRLLTLPLYLFWLAHALQHGRKHASSRYLALRMVPDTAGQDTADHESRIWVHAASVGEVSAVTPLVQALMERGQNILFTSFTATGYQAIQREFADSVCSTVIPIDCFWHCRQFFARHNIKLGVIMETELWPELLYQARRQDIELLLVNARLSKKSLKANKFVRSLLTDTLGYFSQILTRGRDDLEALQSLGASLEHIRILGNLKARPRAPAPSARLVDRDYVLLASSHTDEERDFLAARPASLQTMLVVIAPRHPTRSKSIQAEIDGLGMRYAVRSEAQPVTLETEVYLADTLGELGSLMAHARLVVMGGSFDDTGGHNLIEPAILGCAIITGPSDSNISADIEMLGADQGIVQVNSIDACWDAISTLLAQPERARSLAQEAKLRLSRQPDILQQYLQVLTTYLD
jgi:3-deoxy-D-manno-octulosonic-acid transferase